jgi:large subunit ribosomal protein L28
VKTREKAHFAAPEGFPVSGAEDSLIDSMFRPSLISHPGVIMAMKCELCGKGPQFGNVISHANNTRRRRWNPNLKRVRAVVKGVRKQIRVCTDCIRSGRVQKAA